MRNFPSNFKFGVATAAYQIEGAWDKDGKSPNIWDTFSHTPGKVVNGDTGDVACDFYNRYESDIDLISQLNVPAFRFSFSWSRIFPDGITSKKNQKGIDFYNRVLDKLDEKKIEPFATLYHWDLPQILEDQGGWRNREILKWFADYAFEIGNLFGDRVKRFSPINEPWVVAWLGHGIGVHAPGIADRATAFKVSHHTVLAHGVAVQALRSAKSDLSIGPVLNQTNFPINDPSNAQLIDAQDVLDATQNRFWIDAIFNKKYPDILMERFEEDLEPIIQDGDFEIASVKNDWIGINYYFDTPMKASAKPVTTGLDPAAILGLNVDQTPPPPLTDMGWPISPEGLSGLLIRWEKLLGDKLPPVYITENGCAYGDGPSSDGKVHDEKRIDYLKNHLNAVLDAIDEGVDVEGYFQWSLLDNFEWAFGYEKRFGIVHVDFETQKRTLKDSALWYRDVATIKSL
jgi:beta-glucosidase